MIYIIMPVYNRKDITAQCLESLYKQNNKDFRVIVVDDGSKDGTSEMIRQSFPEVILLQGDGNLWWTGGTNMGIKHALSLAKDEDFVMLLNDDLVVDQNFIGDMYEVASHYPNTLIQAVESDANNHHRIVNGGWKINFLTAKFQQLNQEKLRSDFAQGHIEEVSTQTGRGTLIPIPVFHQIGLYNDDHYPQCGDFEFPIRANRAGYRLIMTYDVPVFSFTGDTDEVNIAKRYKLSDLKSYYWGFRSYANLKNRFWFAYDTTSNWIQGSIFLAFDFTRLTLSFFRRINL